MKLRNIIAGAVAAITIGTIGAANAATVVIHKPHKTIVMKERGRFAGPRHYIARDRVVEVVRGRNIEVLGTPYMYGGNYVVKCRDHAGRVAFCRINPRTGAFLGISVRL
ncbi:MAG TPA: hypothetical protein VGM17_14500 [Rhizomicrobium sp.]|jgi:hypothetical protein